MASALHVISLDPQGPRFAAFTAHNRHLGPINVFKAIRGADIPIGERVPSGLITAELLADGSITEGTLGCAASHRALWRKIAATGEGGLIMEDDVVTHPLLDEFLRSNAELLRDAEVVFFGVNTDSVLATISPQGLTTNETLAPQRPDAVWIANAFVNTAIDQVAVHKLLKGFGLCCYWVSVAGAVRLLSSCFPLTLEGTDIPFMTKKWPGSAIDGRMNAFLPVLRAFITRPFLAYSPNVDSSTSL